MFWKLERNGPITTHKNKTRIGYSHARTSAARPKGGLHAIVTIATHLWQLKQSTSLANSSVLTSGYCPVSLNCSLSSYGGGDGGKLLTSLSVAPSNGAVKVGFDDGPGWRVSCSMYGGSSGYGGGQWEFVVNVVVVAAESSRQYAGGWSSLSTSSVVMMSLMSFYECRRTLLEIVKWYVVYTQKSISSTIALGYESSNLMKPQTAAGRFLLLMVLLLLLSKFDSSSKVILRRTEHEGQLYDLER